MSLKSFLKDKLPPTVLLLCSILTIEIFLMAYPFGGFIKIYIPVAVLGAYAVGLGAQYFSRRHFYKTVLTTLHDLNEKYLIAEILKAPEFSEGKLLCDLLREIDQSMIERVNRYKYMQDDYKDYIELWIHEIKLPIAAGKLLIENHKNEITKSIDEELDKIEDYTEQALFYARSSTVEKDYYIKRVRLLNIVNESIRKNRNRLIGEKAVIDIHDADIEVLTDSKWVQFILHQILQNSRKYKQPDTPLHMEIYAAKGAENAVLFIKDNGIGIPQGDLPRIFDKGFTGTNGRLSGQKSTGIGLYLCKKLCDKLNIGIQADSAPNQGTEIRLIFPSSSYLDIE